MDHTPSFKHRWFSFCLFFLFVIPALNNAHYDPQPQFWAEISVGWAIIIIFISSLFSIPKLSIPWLVLPLLSLASYICLQPLLVASSYPGLNYVAALELVSCSLLAIAISSLRATYGLSHLMLKISYALVIGGLLQSLIGILQYSGSYRWFGDLIFYDGAHPTTNIFGHFGQRNHYAHYLTWATIALIYLTQQHKLPRWLFMLAIAWFSFSLTIAGSRSVLIYFAASVIISLIFVLRKRDSASKQLLGLIVVASLTLVAFEYFFPLLHKLLTNQHAISSGLQRLDSQSLTGRRAVEWAKAWLIFQQHPVFGLGWNSFARQSVILHPLFSNAELNSGLFTNCHNLIMQLLAETGAVGTLIVVVGILIAIIRTVKTDRSAEAVILLCMLATTLAHSMNEFPLWYMYFLAGLVTFLSLDKPIARISSQRLLLLASLPLAGMVYLMISGSLIFDRLVDYNDAPEKQTTFNQQAKYLQALHHNNQLWSYYASYCLDNYINVDTPYTMQLLTLDEQYRYTKQLVDFHPYPDTLIKAGMLSWRLGHNTEAKNDINLAVIAFPMYSSDYKNTLKAKRYQPLAKLIK